MSKPRRRWTELPRLVISKRNVKLDLCLQQNRRLHVFQGRHGIYLIFAEYGQDFLDYLKGNGGHDAYMTMHEYGPWITMSWKQMETPP